MGSKSYRKKLLDVRKDRLDIRDRAYRPVLQSFPESYPHFKDIALIVASYKDSDMILDQGQNGACTGYALATVINYLLWRKLITDNYRDFVEYPFGFKISKVSQKMLYNLARIYDEWDGEDYEGSSCRGAMKGWHKHGVCEESCWEFGKDEPEEDWEKQSIERPLGAYYRVDKESISDMQSALCEVGALYVSASIHDGWWELKAFEAEEIEDINIDIPYIPYTLNTSFPVGNHAFVIVGYTRFGFVVQNSWGMDWGNSGFAILSYKDWLEHGMDVWVAVIGVPIEIEHTPRTYSSVSLSCIGNEATPESPMLQKALSYSFEDKKEKPTPVSEEQAYNHTLILNANGRAKHTIINTFKLEDSIQTICRKNVEVWLKESQTNRKIMLYALGGLQSEKEYIAKIRVLTPYFLANGIYPIFLTWQYSYLSAVTDSIEQFFTTTLQESSPKMKQEVLQDKVALNRAIESHSKQIATRGIWSEIKEKSLNANEKRVKGFTGQKSGTLYMLTQALKELNLAYSGTLELHAMAHSAGSQLLATSWLSELAKQDMQLSSMHLLAPTVSIQDCNNYMIKAHKKGVFEKKDIHIYMLDQEMELADSVGTYSKSLLCLISRSLEKIHKTPLLGLEDSWNEENLNKKDGIFNTQQLRDLKKWQKFAYEKDNNYAIYALTKKHSQLQCSKNSDFIKLGHTTLDSSIFILERVLKIVTTGSEDGELICGVENLC
ncbi:MAG: C1 family peptidase [Epsilonproteobacteria bacterium]|nr:C1 family peptidase [Campylobacterota bacterium]